MRSKTQEVTGGWRKLRNGGLYDLHSSVNIIRAIISRRIRGRHVARMGEKRNVYRVFGGET